MMTNNNGGVVGPFGDTTLTKVFVGGLAWETPKEAMRDHFEKYGDILEAVIISDKTTGRSKGYGFVCFFSYHAHLSYYNNSFLSNWFYSICNRLRLRTRNRLRRLVRIRRL